MARRCPTWAAHGSGRACYIGFIGFRGSGVWGLFRVYGGLGFGAPLDLGLKANRVPSRMIFVNGPFHHSLCTASELLPNPKPYTHWKQTQALHTQKESES